MAGRICTPRRPMRGDRSPTWPTARTRSTTHNTRRKGYTSVSNIGFYLASISGAGPHEAGQQTTAHYQVAGDAVSDFCDEVERMRRGQLAAIEIE